MTGFASNELFFNLDSMKLWSQTPYAESVDPATHRVRLESVPTGIVWSVVDKIRVGINGACVQLALGPKRAGPSASGCHHGDSGEFKHTAWFRDPRLLFLLLWPEGDGRRLLLGLNILYQLARSGSCGSSPFTAALPHPSSTAGSVFHPPVHLLCGLQALINSSSPHMRTPRFALVFIISFFA